MKRPLKYGENPHQKAVFSFSKTSDPLAIERFEREGGGSFVGEDTSWITITDLGRLLVALERFAASYRANVSRVLPRFGAIVKHGSPCGAAFGTSVEEVARDIWKGDSQAAFGGALLVTFPFTRRIAAALAEGNSGRAPFLSSVAAPSFEKGIASKAGAKAKMTHFIKNRALAKPPARLARYTETKTVRDVVLEQDNPRFVPDFSRMLSAGKLPKGKERQRLFADLSLAFAICCASTSNTITIVKGGLLIGNAVGQQKRVGSAKLAVRMARESGHDVRGAVAVSDSFFPFPDGVEALAKGGVRAIFATSGSVRDKEVFARAAELGVAMFTVPDKEGRMFAGH